MTDIMTSRIRWLAIVTGFVVGATGSLGLGVSFLILPLALVSGAAAQPYSPTGGRWLVWIGAFFVSLQAVPLVGVVFEGIRLARRYHDFMSLMLTCLSAVSVTLVVWLDVALLSESCRRRSVVAEEKHSGPWDWALWLTALGLSAFLLPLSLRGIFSYARIGRLDILLSSVVAGLAVLWFDFALVRNYLKNRRLRHP